MRVPTPSDPHFLTIARRPSQSASLIDSEEVRADILDSAGSSLMPRQVLDEVVGHLRCEAEIGGYRAAEERRADLDAGHGVVAEPLGCRPDQVAFTDSATRSWLAAFDAVPLAAGDRILIGEVEYAGSAPSRC